MPDFSSAPTTTSLKIVFKKIDQETFTAILP